jgi:hypothetical protein
VQKLGLIVSGVQAGSMALFMMPGALLLRDIESSPLKEANHADG